MLSSTKTDNTIDWTFHLLLLTLIFLFHLISLGNPTSIARYATQKLDFLSRACSYFSLYQLLTIYKSQIHPSLEYCYHAWGGTPTLSLHIFDKVQPKAIHLINNSSLTNSLESLSHRRLVADLSIFYRYFYEHCSLETKNIIPDPVRRAQTTRSSTHLHPFQVTLLNPRTLARKSSFTPRASQVWNSLPSTIFPESYNLLSFKSIINKLAPYLLKLSPLS